MSAKTLSAASALPFWMSLVLIPLAWIGAVHGGWAVFLLPIYGWIVVSILDAIGGRDRSSPDADGEGHDLFWYRLITLIWLPVQAVTLYTLIWWVTGPSALSTW